VQVRTGHVPVLVRDGVAHFANLASCSSVWACPVCAAKIRQERAEEIARLLEVNGEGGGRSWLVTFTLPHHRRQGLRVTLDALLGAWRRVLQSDVMRALRASGHLVGWVRSVEVTYGANGWHPHVHAVFLSDGLDLGPSLVAVERLWADAIVSLGLARPSAEHGVVWDEVEGTEAVGRYVAKVQDPIKVGQEVTRGDLKAGRARSVTPYDLLRAVRDHGDADALDLWHEYEAATKGRRCVTWSRGLRDLVGVRTDEEIAEDEVGGDLVGLVPADRFRSMTCRRREVHAFLVDVEAVGFGAAWAARWHDPPPEIRN
jgi:hypothetical protein